MQVQGIGTDLRLRCGSYRIHRSYAKEPPEQDLRPVWNLRYIRFQIDRQSEGDESRQSHG
jgi:hypothetical protein